MKYAASLACLLVGIILLPVFPILTLVVFVLVVVGGVRLLLAYS